MMVWTIATPSFAQSFTHVIPYFDCRNEVLQENEDIYERLKQRSDSSNTPQSQRETQTFDSYFALLMHQWEVGSFFEHHGARLSIIGANLLWAKYSSRRIKKYKALDKPKKLFRGKVDAINFHKGLRVGNLAVAILLSAFEISYTLYEYNQFLSTQEATSMNLDTDISTLVTATSSYEFDLIIMNAHIQGQPWLDQMTQGCFAFLDDMASMDKQVIHDLLDTLLL